MLFIRDNQTQTFICDLFLNQRIKVIELHAFAARQRTTNRGFAGARHTNEENLPLFVL